MMFHRSQTFDPSLDLLLIDQFAGIYLGEGLERLWSIRGQSLQMMHWRGTHDHGKPG